MDRRTRARSDRASSAPIAGRDSDAVRSGVWMLLATLLRDAPDASMLERLRRGIGESGSDDSLAAAWQDLHRATRAASPESIDEEFHALFIGLGRGELVPYASWYRTGFLMDRPLVALRGDLAALGLFRRSGNREPEDHAASIAEMMALLADPEAGQDPPTQARFFREHVDGWMPMFFADLREARNAVFYAAVGPLGAAYVEFERQWLQEAAACAPAIFRNREGRIGDHRP